MARLFVIILAVFLIAAGPKRPTIVSIMPSEPVQTTAGAKLEYPLELKILSGYHIQANPASQEYLIPVTVKLQDTAGVKIGEPVYPKGVPFRLKSSDRDISTYDNAVIIKIPMQIEAGMKPGEIVLKGTIRYQGCDDSLCFPPVTLPTHMKLIVK